MVQAAGKFLPPPQSDGTGEASSLQDISYKSAFKDLLMKDSSPAMHPQYMKMIVIEIHKAKIPLNPDFMNGIFRFHESS